MKMVINKHVLLTGAGFTSNIGTPLASEMWSYIFNDKSASKHKEIVEALFYAQLCKPHGDGTFVYSKEYDYEAAYQRILSGKYDAGKYTPYEGNIRTAMKDVIRSAYNWIDEIVKGYPLYQKINNTIYTPGHTKWNRLINNFINKETENYIFTLNQDLFMERHIKAGFYIPGFPEEVKATNICGIEPKEPLSEKYYYAVPVNEDMVVKIENRPNIDSKLFYIKLHGSCNWYNKDKESAMIIGYNKKEQSKSEPLLNYYHEVFENILMKGDVDLLVIGYSFRDDNINDIILRAIKEKNSRLRLHIVNPIPVEDFLAFKHLRILGEGMNMEEQIREGLKGYYPYKLTDIFKNDMLLKKLEENYFN
ncbi:MAG: SIR2 family protein [Elusimicrobia bacterium]|nr:SIR2 family protein [Candidatus Liberimonas magnetica]